MAAAAAITVAVASGVVTSQTPATAAPIQRTAAEGALLAGGGGINIDAIAELGGAFSHFGPGIPDSVDLDLTALSLLNLNLEDLLTLSLGQLVELGVVGQYAAANSSGAVSSSGAVTETGLIDLGAASDPAQNTRVKLGPLLDVLALDSVISDVNLELGALSARAEATRGATPGFVGDYQVAGADLVIASPTLGQLTTTLNSTVGGLDTTVNALTGAGGLSSVVGALLDGLRPILALLGPVADIEVEELTLAVNLNLTAALANLLSEPLVDDNGTVTIDLTAGTIRVDLATLYDLNDVAPNTELLDATTLNAAVSAIIEDLLLTELPKRVLDLVEDTLNTTSATIALGVEADAVLGLIPLAEIDLQLSTTLGGLLGLEGAPAPTSVIDGSVLGLPIISALGSILQPLLNLVTSTVGGVLRPILDLDVLTGQVGSLVSTTVTALDPVFDMVSSIASVRLNVQESPGSFREASVDPSVPSFTQRAVQVRVLPGLLADDGLTAINLASATVSALPLAVPVSSGIAPSAGPVSGGTTVIITGTGFTGATGVTFDGTDAATFDVVSDTEIAVTTPAGTAGPADVVILHPDGDANAGVFTYEAPAITGINPTSGPETGGTSVTITGSNFLGASGVTFDGVPATSVDVVDATQITAVSPPGAVGTADVVVLHPGGDSAPQSYTYTQVTKITGVAPDEGSSLGGTSVTITGSCFTGATDVTFGGVAGTDFVFVDDTRITVTTPAGSGTVDVAIIGADCGPAVAEDAFTFVVPGAPDIISIAPEEGPETGGTTVVITGNNFSNASGVTFGGVPAAVFHIDSDTQITVTTPVHAPGVASVVVEHPIGDSAPEPFTFLPVPSIAGITPDEGPITGGTIVTITGSGFTGATGVDFDGAAGTGFAVVSETEIRVTTPPGSEGPADVVVLHPTENSSAGTFTYLEVPVITGLAPASGPDSGGTVVVITGTGFTGATGVTFDGNVGTPFNVDNDTQITVTTPPGVVGPVDVVVAYPVEGSLPGTFTYVGTPANATSMTPTEGPVTGGTPVSITGSGFTGATAVTFDGVPGASFTVVSETEITVTTPAGAAVGPVPVVVEDPAGDSAPMSFTYLSATTIDTVTPGRGPETGGTPVVIIGSCFTGATEVLFGTTPATTFTVVSDTRIEAESPAGAGVVDITVTGAPACGDATIEDAFTYQTVPVITGITPDRGPSIGGTFVEITGSSFTGVTGVTFAGVPSTGVVFVNDTTVLAVSPPGTVGLADVVVTTDVAPSAPYGFTYEPHLASVVSTIAPDNGPEAGGTVVTITGSGFTGASGVTFGGAPGTSFTVVSDTEITVTTPAGTRGAVDVVVLDPAGDSSALTFTYTAQAVIDTVSPDEGPDAGGTEVTISGSCFTGAVDVLFGSVSATSFTVVNDTTITAVAPAGVGTVDITVVGGPGCIDVTEPDAYTYVAPAVIATIDPNTGPETGGTVVTITGTDFTGATGVTFDGVAGTDFTVVSDTEITVTTPAGTPGVVDVIVEKGTVPSAPGTFTYKAQAVIDTVSPDEGPEAGGTEVTISGSCFTGAVDVLFGSVSATSFTVVNDTTITAVAPAGVGTVDITVVGGVTCSDVTDPDGYTYVAPAVIATIDPSTGPETGGTVVTITGTDFTGATGVTFGGAEGTGFTVVSDTEITVTTPAGAPGVVDVVVLKGTVPSAPGDFTYTAVTTIDEVSPDRGSVDGGTTVTIAGHCFTGVTAVYFGDTAATSFRVLDDTRIEAVAPAGTGTVDITVVGAGECGTGVADGGFRYVAALPFTGSEPFLGFLAALLLMASGAILTARARRQAA
ncbi:MAG: IPT/TIG domain-containing protein [Salinibacterium sp.]|nr:IPT/TIG domain-containing protein [Salinibacterium sp.]MBF0673279.1 IPT/TIG domain-containing protein [Salinibacterium sp.]